MGACLSTPAKQPEAKATLHANTHGTGHTPSTGCASAGAPAAVLPLLVARAPPAGGSEDADAVPRTPSAARMLPQRLDSGPNISGPRDSSEGSFASQMRLLQQVCAPRDGGRGRAAKGQAPRPTSAHWHGRHRGLGC
jgi:hypothetical protein